MEWSVLPKLKCPGDLQHAKIFVSIYGTEEARRSTMEGLRSATGYIRSHLGKHIRLRRTPEVVFLEDRSLERGDKIIELLNQISHEHKNSDTAGDTTQEDDPEAQQ
ncbi:ribosome-binding factor A [Limnospira maxima CS-328]|uniref:Ribosome-binding factor A n=1 Tax=Limnospira maxima CS-328 TaxID=513049 RepID=B5W1W9_LIMMA|nr:ribosome-binding factor A [Limnospira maxima CS-328]